jgi:transmembrane sensor
MGMSDDSSTPGHPRDPYDWDAIGRYLAGESTPSEAAELRRQLAENPDDAALMMKLDEAIARHARHAAASDIDVEAALSAVKARRAEAKVEPLRARPRTPFATTPTTHWRLPGSLALAAGILIIISVALWPRLRDRAAPTEAAQVYRTATGARDSVMLPDSSMIVLGPRSELRVDAGFGESRRSMELEGEAYFNVRHDDARPFVVRAGRAVIRDVGTVFTVRNDRQGRTRVVVTEGAVLMQGTADTAAQGVILHPGDVGTLAAGTGVVAQRGQATPEDLAWTRGELVFRAAPLSEVAEALERWYGVTLRFPDTSTARLRFYGDFRGDPLESVLRQIALSFGANIERRGDTVIFRGGTRK